MQKNFNFHLILCQRPRQTAKTNPLCQGIILKPSILKIIFLGPFILGCQVQSESKISKSTITRDLSAYEKNSCTFTFDQGPLILSQGGRPQYTTVSFQKTFNQGPLLAIVGASAHQMVSYIKQFGVDIFALPQPSKGCRNFSSLPEPPDQLGRFFQEIDRSIGGGALLGLFLSESRALEYGEHRPVIMIRNDADRWTLAHEFIHSLFAHYRTQFEKFDDQVFVDRWTQVYSESQVQFKSIKSDNLLQDPARAESISEQWLIYAPMALTYLKLFPLEEMTVEATLHSQYLQGRMDTVTDFNLLNSSSYIESNFRFAREIIYQTAQLGQQLKRALPQGQNNKKYFVMEKQINELVSIMSEAQSLRDQHVPQFLTNSLMVHTEFMPICGHTGKSTLIMRSHGSSF